jgi:hypothetical protein
MNRASALRQRFSCRLAAPACLLACLLASAAAAEPIPVRHLEGSLRGFLSLRGPDGRIVAAGDLAQVARGSTVTAHLVFHFKDGSLDDETTVFSERGDFRLISDHHIQSGPTFPKPMDLFIDVPHGRVVSRTKDKDGKVEVHTDQMRLPADLANGLIALVVKNIAPGAPLTKVPMLVLAPRPRLVTLAISPHGEEPFTLLGSPHQGLHYDIKIELGGVAGVVAPLVGKQPPDLQMWIVGGDAPTFLREQGPFFQDGPTWTMELASPDWPDSPHSGS